MGLAPGVMSIDLKCATFSGSLTKRKLIEAAKESPDIIVKKYTIGRDPREKAAMRFPKT